MTQAAQAEVQNDYLVMKEGKSAELQAPMQLVLSFKREIETLWLSRLVSSFGSKKMRQGSVSSGAPTA